MADEQQAAAAAEEPQALAAEQAEQVEQAEQAEEAAAAAETAAPEAPVAESAPEAPVAESAAESVADPAPPPAASARPAAARARGSAQAAAIATGRRKTSVARVRLYEGTGSFSLNGRSLEVYFPALANRLSVLEPFRAVGVEGRFDVKATLEGGGVTGQTDALQLGIARALVRINPEFRGELKRGGLLTRDPRKVERKKYGLKKARRAPQYTKR